MCTNNQNPHLIETKNKMHSFHLECHVRDTVTDFVVHQDNTNNTARVAAGQQARNFN